MSYDIRLIDPKTGDTARLPFDHPIRGGTYAVGGTSEAWLNVTYNYADHFYRTMGEDGIRTIYGKTGAESRPILESAMANLGDDIDPDYWASTEGNAKAALQGLWWLATALPDCVWDGD